MSGPQRTLVVLLVLLSALPGVHAQDKRLVTLAAPVVQDDGTVSTAVRIDDATGVIAGDVDLYFDAAGTRVVDVRGGDCSGVFSCCRMWCRIR